MFVYVHCVLGFFNDICLVVILCYDATFFILTVAYFIFLNFFERFKNNKRKRGCGENLEDRILLFIYVYTKGLKNYLFFKLDRI